MWHKFLEGLMSTLAFVSVTFVAPEMPKEAVDIPSEAVVENPIAGEVPSIEIPVVIENQEANKDKDDTLTLPIVIPKLVDPYCAKYASKYTRAQYDKEKEKPEEMKDACEDDNDERRKKANKQQEDCGQTCLVKALQRDCDKLAETYEKTFSDWEEQYDSYDARCQ